MDNDNNMLQSAKKREGEMTNKQLDKWLAEKVMGWTNNGVRWVDKDDKFDFYSDYITALTQYPEAGKEWHPTTSIEQMYLCEDKIIEMELEQEYGDALEIILKKEYSYLPSTFQIAHASPEQRGKAIHQALKEQERR